MKPFAYTYTVIQYVHDPAAGESLNIGVVVFAPEASYLKTEFCQTYERLSQAFVDFDGEHYKHATERFEAAIAQQANRLPQDQLTEIAAKADVSTIARAIWPDQEMSFRHGAILAGISDNLDETLASIYHRMVTSQYQKS